MAPKKKLPKGMLAPINPWELIAPSQRHAGAATSTSTSSGPQTSPTSTTSTGAHPPVAPPVPAIDPIHPLADRHDRPAMRPTRRGSFDLAVAATESTATRRAAIEDLERDFYSASSKRPRASVQLTWDTFHARWFTDNTVPPLPLTPAKIIAVGAMFKAGRYRSFANMLSDAKSRHIEQGFEWTEQLSGCARKVERSVLRGIGPASQCGSFDLWKVVLLRLPVAPVVLRGPLGPCNLIIAGSFFMMREVEISLALWRSIVFDHSARLITWTLPATKSDPLALGKTRSWGCTCNDDADDPQVQPCPYHSMVAQQGAVSSVLGLDLPSLENVPVFPTMEGSVCTKEAVVQTVQEIARLLGLTPTQASAITGHVCRVSGAQHLAKLGFDIVIIQLMARWASGLVLRYVAEAPLGTVTDTYRKLAAGRSLSSQLENIFVEISDLKSKLAAMSDRVAIDLATERGLSDARAEPRLDTEVCRFLVNHANGKCHLPYIGRDGNTVPGKGKCGWKFIADDTRTVTELPADPGLICGVCLPRRRRLARDAFAIIEGVESSTTS